MTLHLGAGPGHVSLRRAANGVPIKGMRDVKAIKPRKVPSAHEGAQPEPAQASPRSAERVFDVRLAGATDAKARGSGAERGGEQVWRCWADDTWTSLVRRMADAQQAVDVVWENQRLTGFTLRPTGGSRVFLNPHSCMICFAISNI